jgi:hypothetical protein
MRKLTIEFASDEAARNFALWLCESGEQQYWDWMEYREREEEDGDITAVGFQYHGQASLEDILHDEDGEEDFMSDWTIRTIPGRLDKQ